MEFRSIWMKFCISNTKRGTILGNTFLWANRSIIRRFQLRQTNRYSKEYELLVGENHKIPTNWSDPLVNVQAFDLAICLIGPNRTSVITAVLPLEPSIKQIAAVSFINLIHFKYLVVVFYLVLKWQHFWSLINWQYWRE